MATLSRRSMMTAATPALLGLPAACSAPAVAAPADPDGQEVDRLFRAWLALQDEMTAATDYTDEWIDGMDARAGAFEVANRRLPPSRMQAAVQCLHLIRYEILWLDSRPANFDPTDNTDHAGLLAMAVLPILMPGLSGTVREVAADFLAHPEREVRHSRLFSGHVRREA